MDLTLPYNHILTPQELERITSAWDGGPSRFTSLATSVILASVSISVERLRFTGRIYVPDEGWDAELEIADVPRDPFSVVGSGLTAYQFKWSAVGVRARTKVLSDLRKLPPELESLLARAARRPDRYVVFTNVDLTRDEGNKLEAALGAGPGASPDREVRLIGAGELAPRLNDLPHLRSAFFATHAFATVESLRSELAVRAAKQRVPWTRVAVGRGAVTRELRHALGDASIRIVNVVGPPGVGKSRLAMDVLSTPRFRGNVVAATDPDRLELGALASLARPKAVTIRLVDEPIERERAVRIARKVLGLDGLRLVILSPDPIETSPATRAIRVDPLSETDAARLVRLAAPGLDYSLSSWIVEQSSGLPGVSLEAASLGPDLRDGAGDFRERIGQALWNRAKERVSPAEQDAARALALLTVVRVSRESGEVEKLAAALAVAPESVRAATDAHVREGILVARPPGSPPHSVEVVPPPLAATLVREAVTRAPWLLERIFADQDGSLRGRLLLRLADAPDIGERFVRDLFDPDRGAHVGLASLARVSGCGLPELAAAFPLPIADALDRAVAAAPLESRRSLEPTARAGLVRAGERLLLRRDTFPQGVRILLALAEARPETESLSRSAEALAAAFAWEHPQVAAPFRDRASVLRSEWKRASAASRRVLVQALGDLFDGSVTLHHRAGGTPFDKLPPQTWGGLWDYLAEVLALLREATDDPDPDGARAAREELGPFAVASLWEGLREPALQGLDTLAGAPWGDGLSAETIAGLAGGLEDLESAPPDWFSEEWRNVLREKLPVLRKRLRQGSLSARLKQAFGPRSPRAQASFGQGRPTFAERVHAAEPLAREALAGPLTDTDLGWLTSDEAYDAPPFFEALGRLDNEHAYLARLVAFSGRNRGDVAFAAYLGGWRADDRREYLDRALGVPSLAGPALLAAVVSEPPDERAVDWFLRLVRSGRVVVGQALHALRFRRWSELGLEKLSRVIEELDAAAAPRAAMTAIALIGDRLEAGVDPTPIGATAMKLLEVAAPRNDNDWFQWTEVASRVFPANPDDLTTLDQIRDALPHVEIPERTRRAYELALQAWSPRG